MTDLVLAGLARLSTCDWPGKLAATVFLQGCPWRCGYCQNPSLADCATPGATTWAETLAFLFRRRGLLDGVVFSGGEPTRQPGLVDALAQVRGLGFATGLHTAGAYPNRLGAALPLLDWVGLDIKAPPAAYDRITGVKSSADKAFQSLRLVLEAGVDCEVRVTVDPTSHTGDDICQLVELLQSAGAHSIVLQEARADGTSPAYVERLAGRRLRDVVDLLPVGVSVR
ncbi:MAG: anaerobic ribonucleoside-triphosphate reductase activating protein [Propionibacteriaceae bacterium]|nr:anaerobic ribonucleoside-triphosphate reductase activating protein [Propionibacteriaceae bacterium]